MAWTTPKTWVNEDPLNESNFNTYIRDNQAALKAWVDNLLAKQGRSFPAFQSPRLVGEAVIGITSTINISSSSYVTWHDKCKLTFTPKTDRVLFGVQITVDHSGHSGVQTARFGLRKGNTNVDLTDTDVTDGALSNTDDLAFYVAGDETRDVSLFYHAPVSVTRAVEVTISPIVKVNRGTISPRQGSRMLLTAQDVGAYE